MIQRKPVIQTGKLLTLERMQELANQLNRDGIPPDIDGTYPFWRLIEGEEVQVNIKPDQLV
ncbi:MAG: hypothetical protein ACEQSC_00510 [Candidatus Nanopelagicaceae bacterium]